MDNRKQLHIVLGGSGAVGSALIKELKANNLEVKADERTKSVEGVETLKADLLDFSSFSKAVE